MGTLQEELGQDSDGVEHEISKVLGKYLENFGAEMMS